MLETLTAASFSDLIGEPFRIDMGELGQVEAKLVQANEFSIGSDSRKSFSLLFEGPEDKLFGQGTFRVENSRLGEMDLFLVCLGPVSGCAQYEAVFT